jgi:hypothetical protein
VVGEGGEVATHETQEEGATPYITLAHSQERGEQIERGLDQKQMVKKDGTKSP